MKRVVAEPARVGRRALPGPAGAPGAGAFRLAPYALRLRRRSTRGRRGGRLGGGAPALGAVRDRPRPLRRAAILARASTSSRPGRTGRRTRNGGEAPSSGCGPGATSASTTRSSSSPAATSRSIYLDCRPAGLAAFGDARRTRRADDDRTGPAGTVRGMNLSRTEDGRAMGHWGVKSYENDDAADALDAGFDRVHGAVYDELMDDENPLTSEQVQKRLANPETLAAAVEACRVGGAGSTARSGTRSSGSPSRGSSSATPSWASPSPTTSRRPPPTGSKPRTSTGTRRPSAASAARRKSPCCGEAAKIEGPSKNRFQLGHIDLEVGKTYPRRTRRGRGIDLKD